MIANATSNLLLLCNSWNSFQIHPICKKNVLHVLEGSDGGVVD